MIRKILLVGICLFLVGNIKAQREKVNLNKSWKFTSGYEVRKNAFTEVNIPHTWNTTDALGGNVDYYRGLGNYERSFLVKEEWKNKRLFLRFLGVNTIANVFVNGKHVGEHRGGYAAFAFEITDFVSYGEENEIWIRVNNAPQLDIMPLVGDFNMYGGIYRDVDLYITDSNCISLLDHGSEGVYLFQHEVSESLAKVQAVVKVLTDEETMIVLKVKDHEGGIVLVKKAKNTDKGEVMIPFEMKKPHLWNGRKDPYIYAVHVELQKNGKIIDKVVQPMGLRYYHVDPDKGFFLNGEHVQLRGVCRHQDRPEIGNALHTCHHSEDVAIMEEIGANAYRMSHYPQDPYMFQLLDEKGFVVWCEIPFVGPGGYRDKGFVDQESFKKNGKYQLTELIRQNMNHPSVLFWGLFNELKVQGDNPVTYIKELQQLAHSEDPTRITTAASNQNDETLNSITDLICWNKYFGWYGNNVSQIGKWADKQHAQMPDKPIGISEYGAGASLYHQQEKLIKTIAGSYWHPENWQTYFHEEHWIEIDQRPFLWGTFIWSLFDFGAAHRREGEVRGKNDKGLVSFDRKERKDAFYFYKVNWNKQPMVYIAEKRVTERSNANQRIKVYSNQNKVTLFLNGEKVHGIKGDYGRFYFDVQLRPGKNKIVAKSGAQLSDQLELIFK
ncbi:beta-glucuronidase LacZ4 [Marinifilum caeruleilacunae]|uniref:Beta-galactosidase n=1 Tax=Marinifilum caeruleilacunae TaxID=2499076 RepID=A0ABX1X021_9BACT|nr:glycoside hydrolase family 2 TIM barrel-domain containing protein [Marinifilum caeruleilacunae]NOU61770.1 beta-galactosidase [Marinifilum caeruleilacunae]